MKYTVVQKIICIEYLCKLAKSCNNFDIFVCTKHYNIDNNVEIMYVTYLEEYSTCLVFLGMAADTYNLATCFYKRQGQPN